MPGVFFRNVRSNKPKPVKQEPLPPNNGLEIKEGKGVNTNLSESMNKLTIKNEPKVQPLPQPLPQPPKLIKSRRSSNNIKLILE